MAEPFGSQPLTLNYFHKNVDILNYLAADSVVGFLISISALQTSPAFSFVYSMVSVILDLISLCQNQDSPVKLVFLLYS